MMLNPVMDEFGRRAEITFAGMSGAVGADDLAAEGDLVGDARDGLSLSQQPQNLHLSLREKLMRRRRMGAVWMRGNQVASVPGMYRQPARTSFTAIRSSEGAWSLVRCPEDPGLQDVQGKFTL